ncbi:hypothetical protein [Spiroplasma sp. SV19]|uniref:hypothetical protein n=1 Tax=Spiroplasma sp. SV19 TaxID=2570468 RepID=UPI0024B6973A|nr:hypothetical protein [Spiroplasma sp. SV19]WHQ37079.1 hypothetical protein E7Y35_04175 [Spiroplasma sp. SV19]
MNISKLNSFFVIDSPREKELDSNARIARNKIINLICSNNKTMNRQILIFSVYDEDIDFDKSLVISKKKIMREPKSLVEISDNEFNSWLSENIFDKLK